MAEQSWLDKTRSFLMNNPMFPIDPIGSTLRNVIANRDAEVQQQWQAGRPNEQFQQAMIPTKKNIALFLQKMIKSDVPAEIVKKYPDLGTALAIAETRYPKHIDRVKKFGNILIDKATNRSYAGSFNPETSDISIVTKEPTGRKSDAFYNLKDYMNTVLHEAAHSDQYNRTSSGFAKSELLTPNKGGTYITPDASQTAVGNLSLYENQPVEVNAFRRGDIAEDSVRKLLNLLPKNSDRYPFSPGEAEPSLKFDMQKLASHFNRAIKEAKRSGLEGSEEYVKDLKQRKPIELYGLTRGQSQYIDTPYRQQFKENIISPKNFDLQMSDVPGYVRNRIDPNVLNPTEMQVKDLMRQVQDAKGVGPLAEWLKKTMQIEAKVESDRVLAEINRRMNRGRKP